MSLVQDIKIGDDNDLYLNQDFIINLSDDNHIADIINSVQGYWKEFPLLGVNLFYYLNSDGRIQEIKNIITTQLQNDGYKLDSLIITQDTDGNLNIEPNAERI